MEDIRYNKLMLRDNSPIKRRESHGYNLITSGYVCVCGHKSFLSHAIIEFPFLHGAKYVEDISCMKCQRIYKLEHDEKPVF